MATNLIPFVSQIIRTPTSIALRHRNNVFRLRIKQQAQARSPVGFTKRGNPEPN